jgi:hypothetical protein
MGNKLVIGACAERERERIKGVGIECGSQTLIRVY